MHLFFLSILSILAMPPARDTGYATIHISIESQHKNMVFINGPLVNREFPIGGQKEIPSLTGKDFDILIPVHETAFFAISLNQEWEIPLVLCPGDSLSIAVQRTVRTQF